MKDVPKLLRKTEAIRYLLANFDKHVNGQKEKWEDNKVLEPADLFSEATFIMRSALELVENVATAWRKDMKEK